ncbi:replication initiation protein [uncultured Jannaschia sp.]|uniref:replication initiation protein n=1 Tax=uncultured Jannaschia sp. TaxID=293347 RepID=UPI00260F2CBF|nr:replication initiation protein [uncultured Jannaschia sp.]
MTATVWEIASAIDTARIPDDPDNAVWLTVPAAQLRGEGGRTDNVWLRECLRRLTGVQLSGAYRGDPWGAVVLAEWRIEEGGSKVRLLIPPAGIHALRAPATFSKIEATAAHRLTGHGRQLYALLADKKRLGRPFWTFELDELRTLMGVDGRTAYDRWNNLRARVIDPAVEAINDYGTVTVRMTPIKTGRSVSAVRFDWQWKDPREAGDTALENDRHSFARKRKQDNDDAPPLIEDEDQVEPALTWWDQLPQAERDDWAERVGRTFEAGGMIVPRRDADLARASYAAASAEAAEASQG